MEIGPIGFGPATFRFRTGRSNRLSHAQRLLCLSSSHLRRFVPNQREMSRTASEIQRLANSVSEAPPEGAEATALRRTVSVGDAINQKASDSSAVVRSSRLSPDGCEHKISIGPMGGGFRGNFSRFFCGIQFVCSEFRPKVTRFRHASRAEPSGQSD